MSGDERHDAGSRREAEKLMPWYVTGKITAAEKAVVEARGAGGELEAIARERDETIAVNEALGAPSPAVFHRLMASIEAEPKRAPAGFAWRDLLTKLTGALTAPMGQRLAAAFAVAIIIGQAAVIWSLSGTDSGPRYQTASGGAQTAASGPGFIVSFNDSATLAGVTELLNRTGGVIAGGPMPGGLYRVKAASPEGFNPGAEAALKASGMVKMVLPER